MESLSNTEPFDSSTSSNLVRLQSKDHEEILNVIDQLRSEGVGKYVHLPQLIVCGDQSSGKSSILEAISGLNFPRKDTVCTRFATELILRRVPATHDTTNNSSVVVSISPDPDRNAEETDRIRQFRSPTLDLNMFADIVRAAEAVISSGRGASSFFRDVLRVEVSGPDQPHLTLVDLPGLYHASDENQTEEGINFVQDLAKKYIASDRSVILAVMSASSDKALQKITTLIRDVDPNGMRTMGIITKPDRLELKSEMERKYFDLAQNKNKSATFHLGWHVLKNRSFEERERSLTERNESEARFLAQGLWSSLPRSQVGIETLRPRLSSVLKDHILHQLPGFIAETQKSYRETELSIQKLGQSRQTVSEQRQYLSQSSEKFNALIRESLNGVYIDTFFGDALEETGYQRRLRAVVQNRLTEFSDQMHAYGQKQKILDSGRLLSDSRRSIQRELFIDQVQQRMRRSRGRELPGTFNPLLVGELFYLQSQPWAAIADEYMELLLGDLKKAVLPILNEILDDQSVEGVLGHIVNPKFTELENGLRQKTAELLQPQRSGHPITYNRDFTDSIQRARDQHYRKKVTEKLKTFFGTEFPQEVSTNTSLKFTMQGLIDALATQTVTDVERFACSEAVDCMEAYYEVAIKKFIDDFSNLAVEKCLLNPLLDIFGPRTVEKIEDNIIEDIAGENPNTIEERNRLTEKLTILQKSLIRLHRLDRHKLLTAPAVAPVTASSPKPLVSSSEETQEPGLNLEAAASSASLPKFVSRRGVSAVSPRPKAATPSRSTPYALTSPPTDNPTAVGTQNNVPRFDFSQASTKLSNSFDSSSLFRNLPQTNTVAAKPASAPWPSRSPDQSAVFPAFAPQQGNANSPSLPFSAPSKSNNTSGFGS